VISSPTFGEISISSKVYFVADIAANHDGSLDRAKKLIDLAAKSGASAAKFQHFRAERIVSERGFGELGNKIAHQSSWEKSVTEVYKEAELPWDWTDELIQTCNDNGIDFFSAPYDLEAIDYLAPIMPFFKVGSGDITWKQSLEYMGQYGKPIFLATGASSIEEVKSAMEILRRYPIEVVLMQCNTNYSMDNAKHTFSNIEVLNQYRNLFPNVVLGLSDHSKSNWSTLAAIALGARVIEKHFTDDCERVGPDHAFSLNPQEWAEMVFQSSKMLEVLGDGEKKVEPNEIESRIVQRRALRYCRDMPSGHTISLEDLVALRPIPLDGISPMDVDQIVGSQLNNSVGKDQLVRWEDFSNVIGQ
jgi:N-acetylneuraminate synthase